MLHFLVLKFTGSKICKKWLYDLFFNEDCNILPMIFHSEPWVDHMLVEKKNCFGK